MKKWVSLLLFLSLISPKCAISGYFPWGWSGWLPSVSDSSLLPSGNILQGSVIADYGNEELYMYVGSSWVEISGGGGGGVSSLNGLTGDLDIVAGTGISVSTSTPDITISVTDPLPSPSPSGDFLMATGTSWVPAPVPSPSNSGTVTSVSVVSTNGFAGTVANATTTPAITMETSITGLLHGNGTAIAAETVSSPILESSGTLSCQTASGSQSGCLDSTDWTTFNNKQSALSFIDSVTDSGGNVSLVNDSATPGDSKYYGTNGSGTLGYFALPSGTPGGSSTDVQYNSSGSFGGDSGMTYDGSGDLTLTGKINATTAIFSNLSDSEVVETNGSGDLVSAATVSSTLGGTGLNTSSDTGVPSISSGTWSVGSELSPALGGTGISTSSSTGVPVISSGTWSIDSTLPTSLGGLGGNFGSSTGALSISSGTVSAGTLAVGSGGTGQASSLTADGVVYASSSSAMATTAAGTSGYVLTSNGSGSAPTFQANANAAAYYYLGTQVGSGGGWSTSSGSYATPSGASTSNTLTQLQIGSFSTITAASSELPGITITFPISGCFGVSATLTINGASGANVGARLYDTTNSVIINGGINGYPGAPYSTSYPMSLTGIECVASPGTATLMIQMLTSTGTSSIAQGSNTPITWTIWGI